MRRDNAILSFLTNGLGNMEDIKTSHGNVDYIGHVSDTETCLKKEKF